METELKTKVRDRLLSMLFYVNNGECPTKSEAIALRITTLEKDLEAALELLASVLPLIELDGLGCENQCAPTSPCVACIAREALIKFGE